MLANDGGRPRREVSADFKSAFGFSLTEYQVSLFRSSHGTRSCRSHGGRPRRPVGFERTVKGYLYVKVAEEATVPQSKDNWRLKHVHVWELEHGPLPDGWVVMFADRDTRNFDPGNLVALPRKYIGRINQIGWRDRETLEAAMAVADLETGIADAKNRPRACGVCGREFTPPDNLRYSRNNTCPECIASGHKSCRHSGSAGEAVCAICGRRFERDRKDQRRCMECISSRPKWSVGAHLRHEHLEVTS